MFEYFSLITDYLLDLSEMTQALIMFGSMILMIVMGVPIPISVAIGTVVGYWFLDFPFVQIALSMRSEEHTSELQSLVNLVCRLLLEKKN